MFQNLETRSSIIKYFAHGSFLGGNGTGAVPDRYLDGIRSFTFGAGYVPRKDFNSLKHSIHLMRRAQINEILYMVMKALS